MNMFVNKINRIFHFLLLTVMLVFVGCNNNDSENSSTNNQSIVLSQPKLGSQIDRVGRPITSTGLMETFNADSAAKDAGKNNYNQADQINWSSFSANFETSLAILDALDSSCGNQLVADDNDTNGRYAKLASILADDQLYVRSSDGECGVYLGIEAEAVQAIAEGQGKCGGRILADDVIERTYSVLAAGVLTGIDDTITSDNDCAQSQTFPFLCL